MSNIDIITKIYMQDESHFADLLNFKFYKGRPVITPESLQPIDSNLIYKHIRKEDFSDSTIERIKDVIKKCTIMRDDKSYYVIVGIENQTNIDYTMPVRNYLTDAIQYNIQIDELKKKHKQNKDLKSDEYLSGISKNDKLIPVITLTIYWGADKWKAAKDLREMLAIDDENILEYINNYNINLVEPASIYDFNKFSTELGPVLEYISISKNKAALKKMIDEADNRFTNLSIESIELVNATTGSHITPEKYTTSEGGVNMCQALQEIIEDEIREREIALAEKDNALAEKDNALAEKDNALAEKDAEIADLKRQLEALKA